MRWMEQPVFFVDFEGSRASGVLEYGVATILGGSVTATETRLCAPTGRVRAEDTEIHGLGEESLRGCAPFSDDWDLFADLRERGPLAAHFAGFENSLLKVAWPYPRSSPDFARGAGATVIDWGPWIDTAGIYAQLYPDLESARLESLVAACSLQAELDALALAHCPPGRRRYHAALYDAIAGALLLGSLSRHAQLASLTVMQLLALSALDPGKRDSIVQRELF
jgi:DNA polymerase III epsilon subunit-like protein